MSCGREIYVGDGAKGHRTLPPPPHPLPPSPNAGAQASSLCVTGKMPVLPAANAVEREHPGRGEEPLAPGPLPRQSQTALGLDFGSRYVKWVYWGDGRFIRRRVDSLDFYRDMLGKDEGRLRLDWERLGLAPPQAVVVTGYGKHLLKDLAPSITEIRAIFLGARFVTGWDHFVLLEMGGQDTKVLHVREARVFDFVTNDRCAAGTGRYLENMARFLKMPLREFSGCWQEPVAISQTCAIFGESELIGHLLEGVPPARLAAGVNASVSRRALTMMHRYRCPRLVFVGGVARNRAVVHFLREGCAGEVLVPPQPQFTGALGCCLEALKLIGAQES
jgi:(R)-2-hydroxyacyl-CoA dehydratese activating ATPase